MKKASVYLAIVAAAALATGCAQFEQALSTLGPTSPSSAAPSLLGTWNSTASIGAGVNSCTNFVWKLTGQQGTAVSGEFSAICGSTNITGTVSGQVNGSDVPYQIAGSASMPGAGACAFAFSGTAQIEGDAIRVPYSGSTCFGPAQGEEVLRRPSQPAAPTPAPSPAPAPTPAPTPEPSAPPPQSSSNGYHVGSGPLTSGRAYEVIVATRNEFPSLVTPRSTESEGVATAAELLRRMIWHLQLAGFQAGGQQNPSGAISNDKLTIFADGGWHAYDVFRSVGTPGEATEVIFWEVFPAHTVGDGGIPD